MERMHITPSGIEDFASFRRHIDNLSVWTMFQLFHSTLLESDRAARGRSLFAKKKMKKRRDSGNVRQVRSFAFRADRRVVLIAVATVLLLNP